MDDKIKLGIGMFIVLAIGGTVYTLTDLPEGYDTYYCEDTNTVGLCFKLSDINADGFSTRCYWNATAPTRYKNCKTGWEAYEPKEPEAVGNETELEDYVELVANEKIISNKLSEDIALGIVEEADYVTETKTQPTRYSGVITFLADGELSSCYLDEPNMDIDDDFEECIKSEFAGKEITNIVDWSGRPYLQNGTIRSFDETKIEMKIK